MSAVAALMLAVGLDAFVSCGSGSSAQGAGHG